MSIVQREIAGVAVSRFHGAHGVRSLVHSARSVTFRGVNARNQENLKFQVTQIYALI